MNLKMKKRRLLFFALSVLVVLSALLSYKYVNYRNSIYYYDTTRDYHYEFDKANTKTLEIKDNATTIPAQFDGTYTAFLKVRVESTFWGKWATPSVTIISHNDSITEYFEDGAIGYRYLNISSLLDKGEQRLSFEEKRVTIKDQDAEFIFFKNKSLEDAKILVIATHPDDAEIAAYGLYSKHPESFVLTIKSGESGLFKYDEVYTDTVAHYRKKGQLRTWNSITVPLLGGIHHDSILNFGYYAVLDDMFLEKDSDIPATFTKTTDINVYRRQNISSLKDSLVGSSTWHSLVDNLQFVLRHVKPDVIVTPYPALDAHREHKYTTIALVEALIKSNLKRGELYLYSNHYVLNEHYPYGWAGGTMPLPPNFSNDIYFKRIFSNNLNLELQNDKLFALEAMHDLRPDTEWRFGKKALRNAYETAKTDFLNGDISYFRRAIRSNELFFIVPVEEIYNAKVLNKIMTDISDPLQ